jgi:hypothetical protein
MYPVGRKSRDGKDIQTVHGLRFVRRLGRVRQMAFARGGTSVQLMGNAGEYVQFSNNFCDSL